MTKLYPPILPYQTRILYLPRRPVLGLEDTIESYLCVADILHPVFGGFGLRTDDGKGDRIIQVNALSYTWGTPEKTANMLCNGLNIAITQNLRDALAAIVVRDSGTEYLWVDQICINQNDDQEKAEQVRHMLQIYELATNTIAWLGDPGNRLADVITAMTWAPPKDTEGKRQSEEMSDLELARVINGAHWIYSAPWFSRLWVQQEIFASQSLRFLCGSYELKGHLPLLSPMSVFKRLISGMPNTNFTFEFYESGDGAFRKDLKQDICYGKSVEYAKLVDMLETGSQNLLHYNHFSQREKTDIVECMLRMRNVGVTDPRDYVYGVLGISCFPSKPMSIQAWIKEENRENFLPVDYSASIRSLWCVLSRILIFRAGLDVLVKFKVNHRNELKEGQNKVPSWVIDWRLSSQLFELTFSYMEPDPGTHKRVESPWHQMDFEKNTWNLLSATDTPAFHHEFCENNATNQEDDFSKLRVKAKVLRRSHVRIMEQIVEVGTFGENEKLLGKWNVEVSVRQDDTIAHIIEWGMNHSVHGFDYRLWLLRPVSKSSFELITCLTTGFAGRGGTELYGMWTLDRYTAENNRDLVHVTTERDMDFWKVRYYDLDEEMFDPVSILTIV